LGRVRWYDIGGKGIIGWHKVKNAFTPHDNMDTLRDYKNKGAAPGPSKKESVKKSMVETRERVGSREIKLDFQNQKNKGEMQSSGRASAGCRRGLEKRIKIVYVQVVWWVCGGGRFVRPNRDSQVEATQRQLRSFIA